MESQALTIGARRRFSMSNHRGLLHGAKAFNFMVLLLCTLFGLARCGPCSMEGVHNPVELNFDACGSYGDNSNGGFPDVFVNDITGHVLENPISHLNLENVCTNLNLFCFPSTLPGFLSEEHDPKPTVLEFSGVQPHATLSVVSSKVGNNLSSSSDCGMFKLSSGRAVSCSFNFLKGNHDIPSLQMHGANQNHVSSCGVTLLNQKGQNFKPNENSETIKSSLLGGSSSLHVEISPPLLDWGQKYLFLPSLAFVKVENTHSDSILNLYEPFSTDTQFYPCNFSEILLGPGEVATICFVFLPTWIGLSSAHLILQTSSGGFLLQARGIGIESPYGILPLLGLDVSSNGRWSKNLSLFNPFDETLYVEEITAWISVSSGDASFSTKSTCTIENFEGSDQHSFLSVEEWFDVKSGGQFGTPLMELRPHRNWEIGPQSTETIIEIDFSYASRGKIFGALCLQLQKSSQDKTDTVIVPLEAELETQSANGIPTNFVSVSLEILVPCDGSDKVVAALSLRNGAPYLLNVVKISGDGEGTEFFQIKYMKGLILFPGTVTQVAVISYASPLIELHDSPPEIPNISMICKLIIVTNDSSNPQIEIPCKDIINICPRDRLDSNAGHDHLSEKIDRGNTRIRSLGSFLRSSPIKVLEMVEADELVLGNWKSQGTASGMTVLDDNELLFPMVQVGTHHSRWITVKNPSQLPVVMQLILNAGEIIDECRASDGLLQPSSSSRLVHSESTTPTRYGFSIADGALTEAYVHPHDRVSFGPILFHPSNRCGWRSSALIRNNLSGVEWLSLRGFGGSLSLALLEGSEPIQSLEFFFNLPNPLNFSFPDKLQLKEDIIHACSQSLSKELYAKNIGDLPLEVRRIEVSGTECGLDGFVVHACKGFALEPGESTKLLISYQTDFSAAMVQRDLELALATGILVIPMKASLPTNILNLCKKPVFWMQVKKYFFEIVLAASVMLLLFFCVLPQLMSSDSLEYLIRCWKSSIAKIKHAEKSSHVHLSQKNSNKFAVSSEMNGLLKSMGEEETLMVESVGRHTSGQGISGGLMMSSRQGNPPLGNQRQTNCVLDAQKEVVLPPSMLSKSVESSDMQEASQTSNLTVRIGKEKGRRRRRKKSSATGLTVLFEVSSSQSGNSTPSSPVSPVTSLTPKRSGPLSPDVDQSIEGRDPFATVGDQQHEKVSGSEAASKANVAEPEFPVKYCRDNCFFPTQEKSSAPRRMTGKPVLLPSATFPSTGRPPHNLVCPSPFLTSTSTVALHARAPGSNLYNRKAVKTEENTYEDQFKYDIWGNHLFGLHSAGRSKEVSAIVSSPTETNSDSFFVRGPQTLMTKFQPTSSGSFQEG